MGGLRGFRLSLPLRSKICNQAKHWKPIVPFQSGGIERRQKSGRLVRPRSARAPGSILVALSRAPARQRPSALLQRCREQLHERRPGMGGDLKRTCERVGEMDPDPRLVSHTAPRAAMVPRFMDLCRPPSVH